VELLLPVVPLEVVAPVAIEDELPVAASPFTAEVVAPLLIDEPLRPL
jgi:hypothetical protein